MIDDLAQAGLILAGQVAQAVIGGPHPGSVSASKSGAPSPAGSPSAPAVSAGPASGATPASGGGLASGVGTTVGSWSPAGACGATVVPSVAGNCSWAGVAGTAASSCGATPPAIVSSAGTAAWAGSGRRWTKARPAAMHATGTAEIAYRYRYSCSAGATTMVITAVAQGSAIIAHGTGPASGRRRRRQLRTMPTNPATITKKKTQPGKYTGNW